MESYLLPIEQVRSTSLHSWGVADGLRVSATSGQPGLTVSVGAALDAAGHLIALVDGSFAITDPDVPPTQLENVPTVPVSAQGLVLSTTGLSGDHLLTIKWREVMGSDQPILMHTPWLRLLPTAGFQNTGDQVVLAQVTLTAGTVTGMAAGPRRAVGVPAERLELRAPRATTGTGLSVEHASAAELRTRTDGGLDIRLLSPDGTARSALSLHGPRGDVGIGPLTGLPQRTLHVEGTEIHSGGPTAGLSFANRQTQGLVETPTAGERWTWYSSQGNARLWSGTDRLTIHGSTGNVGIGQVTGLPQRTLHVEGTEIHSGGPTAGLSFANRQTQGLVETPTAGERWTWYSSQGNARLWSGTDRLTIHGSTGNVGIGQVTGLPQRTLHVEGTEIHSGGPTAGLSFANRQTEGFVETPTAGERWTWYAAGGRARLWSGKDRLTVGSGGSVGIGQLTDVPQRTLHVEGTGIHSGGNQACLSFGNRQTEGFVETPTSGERWQWYAAAGRARLWSGQDRLTIDPTGNVSIGQLTGPAQRTLHVEGSEIHSGGPVAGFSFANRETGAFVNSPTAGERWVWYALGGAARLWSGTDRLSIHSGQGGGLDVGRRMRVRQGSDGSAGIWFCQNVGDRAFIGMLDDDTVGVYAGGGLGWGLRMNIKTGETLIVGAAHVLGHLFKDGGGFRIDHPLDPSNKYLMHSFVESPEMTNFYQGTVTTGDNGEATITLPKYFEALNREHRYQLTPIGELAMAVVAGEIRDNKFTIRTDKPGVTVSWQVTGVRQDAWAKANRITVEENKPEGQRDRYLHPELYEEPMSKKLTHHAMDA
ncbi:hypothetical protein ABZS86_04350 [Streptomyces sp. NPDC005355]|uniref:hypothetical protein n=1 Tax=Streptomyces sp. NPDC005355 TaxID=3157038 RepID=UPI0033BD29F8